MPKSRGTRPPKRGKTPRRRHASATGPSTSSTAQVTTLTHVAQRAGVGESTVSRVLRDQGSVSESTREKILKAAAELNYVPNRIAGTLASMRSKLVGIIIPSVANTVVPEVLAGANSVLEKAGFQPVIGVSNYSAEREEDLIRSILSWRPSGLIITGLDHTPRARDMLKNSGVRVVEILDTDGDGIDIVVGSSHREAGRKSAIHLMSRRYRRIGYVGHDVTIDLRAGKRLEGFRAALEDKGLSLLDQEILPVGDSAAEIGRIGLARLLQRQPTLDAVYFSNDDVAIGGYFYCVENGISLPQQLALFGYNGLEITRLTPQPLSTIRTARLTIGHTAARLLLAEGPAQVVDVGFDLIEGATA